MSSPERGGGPACKLVEGGLGLALQGGPSTALCVVPLPVAGRI
jgi:hypothetical protein